MEFVFAGFFWILLCVLVAMFAHNRGRFAFGWGIVALSLSPLVGWLILLALPDAKKTAPRDTLGNAISNTTHKRCSACREIIRRDAVKCRHCGEVLTV